MVFLHDLPAILALFALVFGTLGLVANQSKALRQAIPYLRRNSLLYLLTALLLIVGISVKYWLSLYSVSEPAPPHSTSLVSLNSTKKNTLEGEMLVNIEVQPELHLTMSFVKVSFLSNPENADVFIEGKLRGKTPLDIIIPQDKAVRYRLAASPDPVSGLRYAPFEGVLQEQGNRQLSVWLDRLN